MKKEMSPEEKIKFKKQYEELADHQITQMLADGREAYVEGAYELLQEEASRRGIKIEVLPSPEVKTPASQKEPAPEPGLDVNTYVQLMIINQEPDRAIVEELLKQADIPYFFQNLNIRPDKDLPIGLMVDGERGEDAIDLLKNFKPASSILLW
jgi:hypothetical protein